MKNLLARFFRHKRKKTKQFPDVGFLLMMAQFDLYLLTARVSYMMAKPTAFLNIGIYYDSTGKFQPYFPSEITTIGGIVLIIRDNRDLFSSMAGEELLEGFRKELNYICTFIQQTPMPLATSVVAMLVNAENEPLGVCSEGKYLLWDEDWQIHLTLH